MNYDPFVLPFSVGLGFLLTFVLYRFYRWVKKLPSSDRSKFWRGLVSLKLFSSAKEIFMESLIHRKIFRINPLLGYMHMTISFGWFLLILVGNIESRLHSGADFNPPYYPIFFKYFVHDRSGIPFSNFFTVIMDVLLLFVLSGVLLAYLKRISARMFGLKRIPKRPLMDQLAMVSLWLIFPLRLLAESFTAAEYGTGSFLTGSLGAWFQGFLPSHELAYQSWWAYSFALGLFFISLPFSRYMHIPAEVLLILERNFGIHAKKEFTAYSDLEVYSCPKCGICVNTCQMRFSANIRDMQSVYFLQSIRKNKRNESKINNCMLCGRCEEYCPVGIDLNNMRQVSRKFYAITHKDAFEYLPSPKIERTEVLYFAGCMTHLTPGIKKAMLSIFRESGTPFRFMDADGTICCGRPLMMAGNYTEAEKLMAVNKETIEQSGARLLVTSCPICYRIFKEEYQLKIEVQHHTQFLHTLVESGKIVLNPDQRSVVFHDPCELGRGSEIYDEPRQVLEKAFSLQTIKNEKEAGLCCGGSLGNTTINSFKRDMITADVCKQLTKKNPDLIVTACPLCKKTLGKYAPVQIKDIAEVINDIMVKPAKKEAVAEGAICSN
jgi:Fe-S oxidoreductase